MNRIPFNLLAVLAFIVLPFCSYAATKAEDQTLHDAYLELMVTGDTVKARTKLEQVGSGYEKLFLMACIELTEGSLDKAGDYAKQLVHMKPDVPDWEILAGLIKRRMSHPEEAWVDSFIAVWKAQGSPELSMNDSFFIWSMIDGTSLDVDSVPALKAVQGTPDELLVSYAIDNSYDPAKQLELALKYSGQDMPLEIRLFALSVMDIHYENVAGDLRERTGVRRLELVRQLAGEFPSLMIYDLYVLLEETSGTDTFDEAEITRLENIVKKRKLSLSRAALYDMYKRRFEKLGMPGLFYQASSANHAYTIFATNLVREKFKATAEAADNKVKLRLAEILEKIGLAHIRQKTLFDLIFGRVLLHDSAGLNADGEAVNYMDDINAFTDEFTITIISRANATFYWPIRPLFNEAVEQSMEDEIKYGMLFSDKPMPEALTRLLKEDTE